jgi:hypothetical protein
MDRGFVSADRRRPLLGELGQPTREVVADPVGSDRVAGETGELESVLKQSCCLEGPGQLVLALNQLEAGVGSWTNPFRPAVGLT